VDIAEIVPACAGEESFIENPICVPPPVGGAACGDQLPGYKSVNCHVDSHDAFDKILLTYDLYSSVLRPGSTKHVVVITDDEPGSLGSSQFDSQLVARDPSLWQGYLFHAIVPFTSCPFAAGPAADYLALVTQTGGVSGDLCTQNFQPVWDQLVAAVVANTKLACEWDIPMPPSGMTLDPDQVNVRYTSGNTTRDLGRVASAAECSQFTDGWYYDDPANPTKILVCPDVCTEIEGAGIGVTQRMDILFGCASRPPMPS
jgi:hypothetical protein